MLILWLIQKDIKCYSSYNHKSSLFYNRHFLAITSSQLFLRGIFEKKYYIGCYLFHLTLDIYILFFMGKFFSHV